MNELTEVTEITDVLPGMKVYRNNRYMGRLICCREGLVQIFNLSGGISFDRFENVIIKREVV